MRINSLVKQSGLEQKIINLFDYSHRWIFLKDAATTRVDEISRVVAATRESSRKSFREVVPPLRFNIISSHSHSRNAAMFVHKLYLYGIKYRASIFYTGLPVQKAQIASQSNESLEKQMTTSEASRQLNFELLQLCTV